MGGGSPKVVHTLGGGLAKGVLGVYKGGGWVKKGQKSAYVICNMYTAPNVMRPQIRIARKNMMHFVEGHTSKR